MRYELSNFEWAAIKPFLPNKPRGVRRANDRRMLNGIFWVLRSGAPLRDLPESFGPYAPEPSNRPTCPRGEGYGQESEFAVLSLSTRLLQKALTIDAFTVGHEANQKDANGKLLF